MVPTRLPRWASAVAGAAILVALGSQLGARPFLDAFQSVSATAVFATLAITAGTTWCCARRWSLIAERLNVGLSIREAFHACYRAQFLNATLPTGLVGDVDRAVWHGHSNRAMSRGVRSVVWDRVSGQVVLFVLALLAIPGLNPRARSWILWLLAAAVTIALVAHLVRPAFVRAAWNEVRSVPAAPETLTRVVGLSTLATAGHLTVFIIAACSVGVTRPMAELIPLGLVFLQVSAIPFGVAGWGLREGGAALLFGAGGLGAATGLAVSVAYGVLSTLATLPGLPAMRRRRTADHTDESGGGRPWVNAPTPS